MENPNTQRCTICSDYREERETWFLVTESCWENKLNIWRWNRSMAGRTAVHSLCSPRHVRELIVHWMATGCVHYPFARACPSLPSYKPKFALAKKRDGDRLLASYRLGEIAIDRERIQQILGESPMSLNTVLDELMLVLEDEVLDQSGLQLEDEYCLEV